MAQATMPEIDGGQHGCWRGGGRNSIKRIKITGAIEASDLGLGNPSQINQKGQIQPKLDCRK